MPHRFTRLSQNWVYGGTLTALVLMFLTPILTLGWPLPEILTFLCLPIYMLHQYEEHDADRFRLFVGQITGTPDALTIADVFWINVIGVWGVMVAILWLTLTVDQGWGVMAAWFLLINGLGHAAQGRGWHCAAPVPACGPRSSCSCPSVSPPSSPYRPALHSTLSLSRPSSHYTAR